MAVDGVQRLDLKDLDAVLARAKAEGWTELALLGPHPDARWRASRLIGDGWSDCQVFCLSNSLASVPPTLPSLSDLTSLDIENNRIGDAGATAIAKLSGLTSLNIRGNAIGRAGAEAIVTLAGLTSLDIGYNEIGDAGAAAIASRLSGLTFLGLQGSGIGGKGAAAIAGLSGLNSLSGC
jgi:hypothetical protein